MNKIKQINNKITESLNKFTYFLSGKKQKNVRRKIYNSLWAILIGLLISAIFISFLRINPFAVYIELLNSSIFSNFQPTQNLFATIFSILVIASIAMAIGFKSGLFNIGVPGQMMTSGMVGILIILDFQNKGTNVNAGIVALAFIVGIIIAAITGTFIGILKSLFNIHEVVSTILLNWVIVYVASFFFTSQITSFAKEDSTGSIDIAENLNSNYASVWWVWVIIAAIIVFVAWIVMSKTTIGYRLKVNGISKEANKYAGTNEKLTTILTMTTSAGLAGLSGSIYYISFLGSFLNPNQPLLLGFHTIAISLLAYNSPIGLVFSSLLYTVLETGNVQLLGISNEAKEITGGIIIYLAALSNMFFEFRLITLSKNYYFLLTSKEFWNLLKHYQQNKKQFKLESKEKISLAKIQLEPFKQEINKIKNNLKLLSNGISLELDISKVKTTEESLNYFANISKSKTELKQRLEEINYYELDKIKISIKAQNKIKKEEFKNNIAKIYNKKTQILVTLLTKKWNTMFKKEGK